LLLRKPIMTAATHPPAAPPDAERVRILPSQLVNQIAAGEVVERPASVVKELVENSIDAGASSIEILLESGGKKSIEVVDDGCGMSHRDAVTSLERHATSKIATFDDLVSISTLGFRGEALPSIASVSRFSLLTFDGREECGIEIIRDPGLAPVVRPASRPRGTTIRVGELFENVPARRKFLKSSDAEFRSIVQIVSSYALAFPEKDFRLSHNGRVVLDLPAAGGAAGRAVQVLGADSEPHLAAAHYSIGEVAARGFVTRALRYGSRRNQFFFVNGRLVRDKVLTHAASRAADAYDFDGHPAIVLFIEMPPELVDVNVHPAKTEVRFRDSGTVHVVVEKAIREGLGAPAEGSALVSAVADDLPPPGAGGDPYTSTSPAVTGSQGMFPLPRTSGSPPISASGLMPLFRERSVVQPPLQSSEAAGIGSLRGRVIGQYRDSYILVDMPEGLRLVDQHVAHERVLYDRIERSFGQALEAQRLLQPQLFDPSAAEAAILDSQLEELRGIGFEIERFSGNCFAISAVPTILGRERVEPFLRKLIDASMEEKESPLQRVRHRVIASLACQAAIKVHRPMSGEEMARVVGELLDSSNPYACPHGRPIIVDIRHLDIEKHFHRK
jgi:DNA mismatch repair protein MutL